jgi:hypothetical protein
MHPKKKDEKEAPKFQKKHFEKLGGASQLVCTCALKRVVTT